VPHILIVDDDAALLHALPEAVRLRMHDVRVETCDSALAALERIARTDYDAIVSDIKMPGMDGLALLERIHALRPATPTLLITGHGEHDLAIQALRGGAYDFIQKPIEREYFVASLGRAIERRALSRQVDEQRAALEQYASSLEQAVAERTRELVAANRAKDDFLGIASHELKTPLTTLKAVTQMAQRRIAQAGDEAPTYLDKIARAIGRMQLLVDDLIDISRIESGKLALHRERCDVIPLFRQVVEDQAAASDRAIAFTGPTAPLEAEVDADRVEQVLTNLLSNALKYTPAHAAVAVEVAGGDDTITFRVRDKGPGIPPEELPHLFDRFYRVPGIEVQVGSGIGLGLGLYICREIVERHGGRIWAESRPGHGSVFQVVLPRVAPQPALDLASGPAREPAAEYTSAAVAAGESGARMSSKRTRPLERDPEARRPHL
jgi:signal transduction histidine kinase